MLDTTDQTAYQAALIGSAYHLPLRPGYLRLTGDDRAAFLQRQTTNDVRRLSAQRTVLTALVTPSARILDVLRLVDEGDTLGVICLPGRGAETARYLKSRIFFMDKVSLVDASQEIAQLDLEGPQAGETLLKLGFSVPPGRDEVAASQLASDDIPAITLRAIGQPGFAGQGYRLLLPAADLPAIQTALQSLNCQHLTTRAADVLRIEAGLPAAGAELSEEYTPLEAGLESAVAENKGCYTGQEIIARQLTYDKVTQRLVGLRLPAPVEAGSRVLAGGRAVGTVTSAAHSPRFGSLALAVIRRPHHLPGASLMVGDASALVCELPFR